MNFPILPALALSAAALTGYAAGRTRPAARLLSCAQDTVTKEAGTSPAFWAAAPVILLAWITVWTLHPRRSAANRRSWHEEHPPPPTPARDPHRPTRETDTPT
ncbi:hypothetical protein [Streptomyces sp. H27-H5]|uniref:hypothetical protein n=1 Tax=Streptomyces sp. H27-H5 TaxID=2996460 RepID=UPI00226E80F7|nr:hypothetical protein [Streptomyces sp. H27-H5]MCY0957680.1 hypothetical protein [Streptomyces sp. H27-H5]